MRLATLAVLSLIVVACGPMDLDAITVTDHTDALTSAANDNLFTLTLSKAPAPLAMADLLVTVGFPGQTTTAVNFTHNDTNGDGKLDVGESLSCKEPPLNLWDASVVGKTATISLDTRQSNSTVLRAIASAQWTPAN